MYKEKLNEILKLIEENHIDMYFNITKEELNDYINKIFDENNINNDYDFYYYTNVIIKKLFDIYDSHTKLIWNDADSNLPIRLKYIDNKLYIIRTDNNNIDLLYGQVLKINDVEINKLIEEIKNMTAYSTEGYLEIQIENILYNGVKLRSLPSIDINSNEFKFEILKNNEITIRTLTKQINKLIDLNKMKKNYSYEIINDTIYIVYNACKEEYENQMINFVNNIKEKSTELNIDKFIVDIRGNQGGNSEIINPLIDFLKDKEVVTLVDKYVFSSGRWAIFYLKNISSKFIGTKIGTSLNCFGNSPTKKYDNFILPISNSYFYVDTTYKIENNKCAYTKEEFNKLKKNKKLFIPQIFEPDYYIKNSIEDYINNNDRVLEYALDYIKNNSKRR